MAVWRFGKLSCCVSIDCTNVYPSTIFALKLRCSFLLLSFIISRVRVYYATRGVHASGNSKSDQTQISCFASFHADILPWMKSLGYILIYHLATYWMFVSAYNIVLVKQNVKQISQTNWSNNNNEMFDLRIVHLETEFHIRPHCKESNENSSFKSRKSVLCRWE